MNMEKSKLDEFLRERAELRFAEELKNAVNVIRQNDILRQLKIKSVEGNINLIGSINTYSVFTVDNYASKKYIANFHEIKKSLIEKYEIEEFNALLDVVDSINSDNEACSYEGERNE